MSDLTRRGLVQEIWMAPPRLRELRRILRYRNLLVGQAVQLKCRIASLLMETGTEYDARRLHGAGYFAELMASLQDVPDSVTELLRMGRAGDGAGWSGACSGAWRGSQSSQSLTGTIESIWLRTQRSGQLLRSRRSAGCRHHSPRHFPAGSAPTCADSSSDTATTAAAAADAAQGLGLRDHRREVLLFEAANSTFSNRFTAVAGLVAVLTEFAPGLTGPGYVRDLGASGFRDVFDDGSNQVRHFVANFAAAFFSAYAGLPAGPVGAGGAVVVEQIATVSRDLIESLQRGDFEGEDIALDIAAGALGTGAAAAGLGHIGDVIRTTICK